MESAPQGTTISELLLRGDIDAFMAPRPPSRAALADPNIGWLFNDPTAAAKDYYKRSGVFPIMHVAALRKELAAQHPWLPGAVQKAFTQAKAHALEQLSDTSATKVTLPFVEEQLKSARETLGGVCSQANTTRLPSAYSGLCTPPTPWTTNCWLLCRRQSGSAGSSIWSRWR